MPQYEVVSSLRAKGIRNDGLLPLWRGVFPYGRNNADEGDLS